MIFDEAVEQLTMEDVVYSHECGRIIGAEESLLVTATETICEDCRIL